LAGIFSAVSGNQRSVFVLVNGSQCLGREPLGVGDTYAHGVPYDDCHAFYEDGNDTNHLHANDSGDASEGDSNAFRYTHHDMLSD
tara:strand:- start:350 stop:604 length:255 start_codon:yes stop_codon:yes gene_type:complete